MPALVEAGLFGIVIPGGTALLAWLFAWRPWRGVDRLADGAWGGAVAVAGGYVAGYAGLHGWPSFPPVEATQWLVYLALGAAVLGVTEASWKAPAIVRLGWRAAASLLVPALLLGPLIEHTWSAGASVVRVSTLAGAVFVLWTLMEDLAARTRGASMPLALVLLATGSGGVLLLSGSAVLGQLGGVLAAIGGAALVLTVWRPGISLARGTVPVFAVVIAGLWLAGIFYAEVPAASAILLFSAPVLVWGTTRVARRLKPWQGFLARSAAALLPLGLAVALAIQPTTGTAFPY